MTLMVLCVAALGLVAYAISGSLALVLRTLRISIERLAPAAQARLYLFAALLPLLASVTVLTAALAPYFGWIADHCGVLGDPHAHPHICAEHHVAEWPALPLLAIAAMASMRLLLVMVRHGYALVLGQIAHRKLEAVSMRGPNARVRMLPGKEAQAFVLGLFFPKLYVTHELVFGKQNQHLEAVIAHEQAHLKRRDPLRKFVAGIGLSFHLPWLGDWLGRKLDRAHEMAADEVAAKVVGSRERVASALIALARSRRPEPTSAMAFSGSEVQTRVLQLLDGRERRDTPKPSTLALGAGLAFAIVAAGADAVHHGVELLLGALGG